MQKIELSVCYMVKNEAENLPVSLASIKDAADEVVVVDTGSQDNTKEIAAAIGARVYDFPWQDDFSAPRNYAIEQAQGEWILFLDADEYFPSALNKDKLLCYLAGQKEKDAILLLRYNIENDKERKDWRTDWCLRIFRNVPYLRYKGRIHENIARHNGELQVAYAPTEWYLYHTGYKKELNEAKAQRNLRLLQQSIREEGWQPGYDLYLMDCYYGLQEYEKALQHGMSLLRGDCYVYGGMVHVYHMILECMRFLHRPDEDMLPFAQEACREYPDIPEFYGEQGMILCGMGQLIQARQLLIDALLRYEERQAKGQLDGYFSPVVAAKVAARLGEIAMHYEDEEEAAFWFRQAMTYCDNSEVVLMKYQKYRQWAAEKGLEP
ncbi:Glycosyltransferase involved in cell wall bisynthesis [Selenomonas ruminantium]|uniref:Glycosyltransferase involved in cell wall bisynthesis n=1 Tax=Selenomonas ruminantium TaxID=971 RepID=A0A1M6UME4_SELRU|nr:glycosyltransferase family 2 protein [Selenomonas ruminantium]SHK70319.1 Glycosyltransferase involved in cell wall bisynthesis [Selenomonas ruminantium]